MNVGSMDIAALSGDLGKLDALLRRRGMVRGPDTWQSVYDLLFALHRQGRMPKHREDLAPYLSPLICRKPEEQEAFPRIFHEWLHGKSPPPAGHASSPAQLPYAGWRRRIGRIDRRGLAAVALAVLLTAGIVSAVLLWPRLFPGTPDWLPPKPPEPQTHTISHKAKLPAKPKTAIEDWAPPNRLPELIRLPDWQRKLLPWLDRGVPWLPVLPALPWLIWRYRGAGSRGATPRTARPCSAA